MYACLQYSICGFVVIHIFKLSNFYIFSLLNHAPLLDVKIVDHSRRRQLAASPSKPSKLPQKRNPQWKEFYMPWETESKGKGKGTPYKEDTGTPYKGTPYKEDTGTPYKGTPYREDTGPTANIGAKGITLIKKRASQGKWTPQGQAVKGHPYKPVVKASNGKSNGKSNDKGAASYSGIVIPKRVQGMKTLNLNGAKGGNNRKEKGGLTRTNISPKKIMTDKQKVYAFQVLNKALFCECVLWVGSLCIFLVA